MLGHRNCFFQSLLCLFIWEHNRIIWAVITFLKRNLATGIKFHSAFQPWKKHKSATNTKKCKNFHIQVNVWQQKRITFVYLWKQLSSSKQMTGIRLRKTCFGFLDTHTYSNFLLHNEFYANVYHTISWPLLPSHRDNDSSIIETVHIWYIWF